MKTTLAVVLIAGAAWAGQTAVGNWLTRPEFKTLATATYYVSPIGSDTGACTATGTGACATLTGAIAKLPPNINHAITINVAGATDGGVATYTENPVFNNFNVNAAITITGPALVNATPATGTATGTLTAVTLGAVTVLTDSTQSWTVNNLIGNFVTISSVQRVIATNTATTMTLASPFTSNPVIGNSYAIQTPAAVITSATSPTLAFRLNGNTGGTGSGPTVSLTGIDVVNTASNGTACIVAMSNHGVSFINSKVRTTSGTAATGISYRGGGSLLLSPAAVVSTGNAVSITASSTAGSTNPLAALNIGNAFMYGTASGLVMIAHTAGVAINGASGWTAQTNSTSSSAAAISLSNIVTRSVSGAGVPILRCLQAGPSGLLQPSTFGAAATFPHDALYVDGCTTGINMGHDGDVTIGALTCSGTGTCISVANGGEVRASGTLAMQDGGTDISIDGVTYTATQLTTVSPTRISNLATGSAVWQ